MTPSNRKVIVITGGSGGIGAALARKLGARGDRLVLAARREKELADVARAVESAGGEARAVVTDVTKRGQVVRLRDRAIEEFGQIDVWINNAGRGITRSVLDLSDDEFDDMMTVNVKSALYGVQAIAPYFIERGRGHIINVSSFLGRVPIAVHRSAYNAAKHALNALTANLRSELEQRAPGVHVSLVMPGVVNTEFVKNAAPRDGAPTPPPPTPRASGGQPILPQTAEEVAEVMAKLIDEPVAEVYTNPAHPEVVRRYYADPGAFRG